MLVLRAVAYRRRGLTITAQATCRGRAGRSQRWPARAGHSRRHIPWDLAARRFSPRPRSTILVEAAEEYAHRQHPRPLSLRFTPSATSLRAPMKQSSSTITGSDAALEHAADADAAGDVHALADLGAGATVDQVSIMGGFIDIGAEIDEGGHQHDVAGDEAERRTIAPGTARKPASRKRSRPSLRTSRAPCPTTRPGLGRLRSGPCR